MDNHPIPQDITGFQFKLIGDMTLKQFAYLAGGLIPGWIFFVSPIPGILKIPVSGFFIAFGLALAFIPIEGRPLDLMIGSFIRALLRPTQFVYQKRDLLAVNPVTPIMTQPSSTYNNVLPQAPILKPESEDEKKEEVVTIEKPDAEIDKDDKAEELVFETNNLEKQLQELKTEEQQEVGKPGYDEMHQKVLSVETLLNQTLLEKQKLENEILALQKKLEDENKKVFSPSQTQPATAEKQNVRIVTNDLGKKIGLPIATEYPNIVTGIIKDPRGNPLSNILVEVKDNDGNPVRAFKTNPLGQFASATPLVNGIYTIEFEDSKNENKFDTVRFEATGVIIFPIEVTSVDQREELRKSLFTN